MQIHQAIFSPTGVPQRVRKHIIIFLAKTIHHHKFSTKKTIFLSKYIHLLSCYSM